jgi:transposase
MRHKLGDSATQIHQQFVDVYGHAIPAYSTVTNWIRQFEAERESVEDEERSGRPVECANEQTLERLKAFINEMISQDLGMRKICCRWILHLLSPAEKEKRVRMAREILDIFQKNKNH